MTFIPQLMYGDGVVRMPLDIYGDGAPFCFELMGGSSVVLDKGDGDIEYPGVLHFTEDISADEAQIASEQRIQNWQKKGIDLDVPPGEKWTLTFTFAITRVDDVEIETLMTVRGVSGSTMAFSSPKEDGEVVHITSEINCHGEHLTYSSAVQGKAQLTPGSVRINGKKMEDFKIKSVNDASEMTYFEGIGLDEYIDGYLCVEYDVKVKPGKDVERITFVNYVRNGKGDNLATTGVTAVTVAFIEVDALCWVLCILTCLAVACVGLIFFIKRKEK